MLRSPRSFLRLSLATFVLFAGILVLDLPSTTLDRVRAHATEWHFKASQWLTWREALRDGQLAGPVLGANSPGAWVKAEVRAEAGDDGTRAQPSAALRLGFAWLARTQRPDGSWGSDAGSPPSPADLENTAVALLAFLEQSYTERYGPYRPTVKKAIAWLLANQRPDGAFVKPGWTEVDGAAHALAAWAVCEAAGRGRNPATMQAAQRATDYSCCLHQTRNGPKKSGFARLAGGLCPDLFTTTLFVMHLKAAKVAALHVPHDSFDGIISFLDSVQTVQKKLDTGEGPPSVYALVPGGKPALQATLMGALCRRQLGWKQDEMNPTIEAALAEFGGPHTGRATSDVLGNLFATWCAFEQRNDIWKPWSARMNLLAEAFDLDAEDLGSCKPAGVWRDSGRTFATAMNLLALDVLCWRRYFIYRP